MCRRLRQQGRALPGHARGGDIDLLVVSDVLNFREVLRLRRAILDRIVDELKRALGAAS